MHQESEDSQVKQVYKVHRDSEEMQDNKEHKEKEEHQELQDNLEAQVPRVHQDPEAQEVRLVKEGHLDNLEVLDSLVSRHFTYLTTCIHVHM